MSLYFVLAFSKLILRSNLLQKINVLYIKLYLGIYYVPHLIQLILFGFISFEFHLKCPRDSSFPHGIDVQVRLWELENMQYPSVGVNTRASSLGLTADNDVNELRKIIFHLSPQIYV